ncbi:MAG: PSD1 and planctomycete cytochrome C domain-containing protein [Pirellulales bacterium]|nr:PSD1 and planctomycete cytochrome C domain-containing protein [Pirellulales bacterium]
MPARSPLLPLIACLVLGVVVCLGQSGLQAAEPSSVPDFDREVAPLLIERCGSCHSKSKRAAKLNLVTPAGIARGGDGGPAVVPGEPDNSSLWQRVADDEMPPEQPLSAEEKELLRAWIAAGAPQMPRLSEDQRRDGADHWAFTPPVMPPVPLVADPGPVCTPIDAFVIAALAERGLQLAPEADRTTLVRRVACDLTGLPPTPEEIALYLSDAEPGAYERMVDRYLASPHYGERWGKYWLDAAGYADSNGYFNADTDRPLAWRYRDYVVASFNADKPWDQFLREQIAGDALAGYTSGGDILPDDVELLVATHFLRNSPDGTGESDGNDEEVLNDRMTVLEGTVNMFGAALFGMTVACAKCHDHKFEPITQREYYELQAILLPTYSPEHWLKPNQRVVQVGTVAERETHAAANQAIDERIKQLEGALAERKAKLTEQLRDQRLAALDSSLADALRAALATPEDQRNEAQTALLAEHQATVEVTDEQLAEAFSELGTAKAETAAAIEAAQAERPAPLEELAVFYDQPDVVVEHHVSQRGVHTQPGEVVGPGVPAGLCTAGNKFEPHDATGATRRLEFARWLVSPEQPLTARVLVNRVWQQHFGRGLVETTENLGYTGAEPSHPELLDYLAVAIQQGGWRLKDMHRQIMHSAVYRQSSRPGESPPAVDPENRLLSRFPLRRLDAEALRDSMLAAGGELDRAVGGPYIPSKRAEDGNVVVAEDVPGALRRSIYLQQRRTQVASLLEVFDAPSIVASCTRRSQATVPLQALALMNADFVRRRAAGLASRAAAIGPVREQQVEQAFLLAMGRAPRATERSAAARFFAEYPPAEAGETPPDGDPALVDFCHMLLASNAFLYVE